MSITERIRVVRAIVNNLEQLPAADPNPHVATLNDLRWQMANALDSICDTLEELDHRISSQVPRP